MRFFLLPFVFLSAIAGFAGSSLAASEAEFFQHIEGQWSGPGEIVAGKYKGTRFVCQFDGSRAAANPGMKVDGSCRVGMFSQPMNAAIELSAAGYQGKFLDGEDGEGMDVTGGRYTASRLVVSIKRKTLTGAVVARLDPDGKLNVTISVDVQGTMVPVIGMSLARSQPITRTSALSQ